MNLRFLRIDRTVRKTYNVLAAIAAIKYRGHNRTSIALDGSLLAIFVDKLSRYRSTREHARDDARRRKK
jgi:hypothetical protein